MTNQKALDLLYRKDPDPTSASELLTAKRMIQRLVDKATPQPVVKISSDEWCCGSDLCSKTFYFDSTERNAFDYAPHNCPHCGQENDWSHAKETHNNGR